MERTVSNVSTNFAINVIFYWYVIISLYTEGKLNRRAKSRKNLILKLSSPTNEASYAGTGNPAWRTWPRGCGLAVGTTIQPPNDTSTLGGSIIPLPCCVRWVLTTFGICRNHITPFCYSATIYADMLSGDKKQNNSTQSLWTKYESLKFVSNQGIWLHNCVNVWDMRFSWQWLLRVLSSGVSCRVVWQKSTMFQRNLLPLYSRSKSKPSNQHASIMFRFLM
jgi:hypothetical protein